MRMMKLLSVMLAVAVSTCTMTHTAHAETRDGHGQTITAVTYNIHSGVGMDKMYDVYRVCEDIRWIHPDIVGLQEVDANWSARSHFDNQVKKLAYELQMNYFFAPMYDRPPAKPGAHNRQHGTAILSRFPIYEEKNHRIARLSTDHPNDAPALAPGFVDVKVEVGKTPLHVYVTHLDDRSDPTVRKKQVDDMVRIMEKDTGTQMLFGDLNAPSTAPELRPLWNLFQDATVSCKPSCNTYPADKPTRRMDYILVTPDIQVVAARTLPTTASDHRPFILQLAMPKSG
ncbi:endonuclease/exonuclease/phosphatase family protein [Alicyclobacillus pomorum]|uniref:endonuclease/exonuclease/phosphatase family protein n=1 Tax=Alicyclobacillus pomorum TaxID=204470 RepID=UPI0003F4FB7E|nr:endonuclease/exonuclease/phosphatase family protein [Alicyclobacillus pomorum]